VYLQAKLGLLKVSSLTAILNSPYFFLMQEF